MGAEFPGKTVLTSIVLADVKPAHGPSSGGLTVGATREVFGFLAPYGRRDPDGWWYRAMVWDRHHQVPDSEPVDNAEISDILARAMHTDFGVVDISWKSRFHCDERQVEQYRHGRVFLAGDAAHVHSPMGGLIARAVTLYPRPARWLRNLLVPNLLRIPPVRDWVAGSFAGTTLRYGRRGPVGTRTTSIPLLEGRLTESLRAGRFVFVREHGAAPVEAPGMLQAERADAGPAVLVRPNGYIAWAGASAEAPDWIGRHGKLSYGRFSCCC